MKGVSFSKVGIEGNFLNLIKNINKKKPLANIILTGEKLDVFPLKLANRQGYPHLPLLSASYVKVLANAVRQGNKSYTDWEGKNKTVLSDDNCLYRKFQRIYNSKKILK